MSLLTVKELTRLARALAPEAFRAQMGPFTLIRRPPGALASQTEQMGLPRNSAQTQIARPEEISRNALALLFDFEELTVVTLPPIQGPVEFTVGRLPDCDLVLDDPSVSKRHAVLRWREDRNHCTVVDLASTNGTFLNASTLVRRETPLRDGDILSFGDVQFWYLLPETLRARLAEPPVSTGARFRGV